VPSTLEVDGPERLVINFQGLDCVTFVENVLTLSRFVRGGDVAALLDDRVVAEQRYEALLTEIRYRQGRVEGYPSRLHYFTDWIESNEERGLVRDVTREIGADLDTEPVDFMTTHTEAYRQLSDPEHVARIREAEERLSEEGRWYLPQDRLAAAVSTIRDRRFAMATSSPPPARYRGSTSRTRDSPSGSTDACTSFMRPSWGKRCRSASSLWRRGSWESGHRTE
jgi:hypothetical protein